MDRQLSLFGDEDLTETVAKIPKIRPRPPVKKQVVISPTKDQKQACNKRKRIDLNTIPFKKEADILLSATDNRAFVASAIDLEYKMISDCFVKALEKIGGSVGDLVKSTAKILKERRNLYINQAIEYVIGLKRRPKIRRKI